MIHLPLVLPIPGSRWEMSKLLIHLSVHNTSPWMNNKFWNAVRNSNDKNATYISSKGIGTTNKTQHYRQRKKAETALFSFNSALGQNSSFAHLNKPLFFFFCFVWSFSIFHTVAITLHLDFRLWKPNLVNISTHSFPLTLEWWKENPNFYCTCKSCHFPTLENL